MKKILLFVCLMTVCFQVNAITKKKTVIDMEGTEVTFNTNPERIICISPVYTEYMLALGMGDKLIGTHKNTKKNPWLVKFYPEISKMQTYGYSPNVEDILSQNPDLVIITANPNKIENSLRKVGIPVIVLYINDYDYQYQHIKILGDIFGAEIKDKIDKWEILTNKTRTEILSTLNKNNVQTGPSVYVCNAHSNKGTFNATCAGTSALESYIESIKARNLLHDFKFGGNAPSNEEILKMNPDVILLGGEYSLQLSKEFKSNNLWERITAVKENNIYIIPWIGIGWDESYLSLPIFYEYLANIFYPDVFNYDYEDDAIPFYKDFYNITLSKNDIELMEKGLPPNE